MCRDPLAEESQEDDEFSDQDMSTGGSCNESRGSDPVLAPTGHGRTKEEEEDVKGMLRVLGPDMRSRCKNSASSSKGTATSPSADPRGISLL